MKKGYLKHFSKRLLLRQNNNILLTKTIKIVENKNRKTIKLSDDDVDYDFNYYDDKLYCFFVLFFISGSLPLLSKKLFFFSGNMLWCNRNKFVFTSNFKLQNSSESRLSEGGKYLASPFVIVT